MFTFKHGIHFGRVIKMYSSGTNQKYTMYLILNTKRIEKQ